MHPFFNTFNRVLFLLVGWLMLTFSICVLVSFTTNTALADSLILLTPLYLLSLAFILPNYNVCRGLPLGQTSWLKLISSQLLTLIVIAGMWLVISEAVARLFDSMTAIPRFESLFEQSRYTNLAIVVMQFEVTMLLNYLYFALEKSRHLEQAALKQKLLISQAELQTLKATVHPHFLFNSLNTLSNIALSAPEQAHRFCLLIAEFLRYSVAYSKRDTATLADELEHVQNYLGIERERFGERLKTTFNIDEGLRDALVPPLIFFPIVENAIKHGIDSCIEGGTLEIMVQQTKESLVFEVTNPVDELGRKLKGTGHGLASVEQRLKTRYGDKALLKTERKTGSFTTRLILPIVNEDQVQEPT
jgi:two-component system LytT family sensor kinase